jgi:hypothetical protein
MGDSEDEREAVRQVCDGQCGLHLKTIKFLQQPDANSLQRQLDTVVGRLAFILDEKQDLDITLAMPQPA